MGIVDSGNEAAAAVAARRHYPVVRVSRYLLSYVMR